MHDREKLEECPCCHAYSKANGFNYDMQVCKCGFKHCDQSKYNGRSNARQLVGREIKVKGKQ